VFRANNINDVTLALRVPALQLVANRCIVADSQTFFGFYTSFRKPPKTAVFCIYALLLIKEIDWHELISRNRPKRANFLENFGHTVKQIVKIMKILK
jgi:hypothetical protein